MGRMSRPRANKATAVDFIYSVSRSSSCVIVSRHVIYAFSSRGGRVMCDNINDEEY